MAAVFSRSKVEDANSAADAYAKICIDKVGSLFRGGDTLDDIRDRFRREIEFLPYPTNLTPGDSLMRQGQAEVVRNWLHDPRAAGDFGRYPPLLMAWESLNLPAELYYSPVADGTINFGVCGVDAELLRLPGAWPELEELIDDAGKQLRRILRNRILEEAQAKLLSARKDGVSGERLWRLAVLRFRQLAYYFLPDTGDYHTKLVRLADLDQFAGASAWKDAPSRKPLPRPRYRPCAQCPSGSTPRMRESLSATTLANISPPSGQVERETDSSTAFTS